MNYNKLGQQKLAGLLAEASGDDVQGFSHMIYFIFQCTVARVLLGIALLRDLQGNSCSITQSEQEMCGDQLCVCFRLYNKYVAGILLCTELCS